jgi:hypothetical protein
MGKIFRATTVALALALPLVATAPATAAQSPVVTDCVAHGKLTRSYTEQQLRTALSTMSANVKEYTDCSDVIERALLQALSHPTKPGKNSSSTSGGSFLPTPVIVVLVLLVLAGVTFGAIAIRRRQGGVDAQGGGKDPPGGAGTPPSGS